MAGETEYLLGEVPLTYAAFEWPAYRGAIPIPVVVDFDSGSYDAVAKLATGLAGKPTTLKVTTSATNGASPQPETVTIQGVYIDRVVKLNDEVSRVTLYDARWPLSRRVADLDFLIRFGDEYLEDTDKKTYTDALKAYIASVDLLKDASVDTALDARSMKDGQYLSGMALPHALGLICEAGNCDLTVNIAGELKFVRRDDNQRNVFLPRANEYDWLLEPSWIAAASVVLGRPREFHNYYTERHCLKLQQTGKYVATDALDLELEQVYCVPKIDAEKGLTATYLTLEELLVRYGMASNAISDATIAAKFMTRNFEGTAIEADGSANRRELIRIIKDGWRVLWRLTAPRGERGAWTDFAFGKIKPDGSATLDAVDCPWVEFLNVIDTTTQVLGAVTTHNHVAPAPFSPQWEGDPSSGIIRLVQKPLEDGNIAIPGVLTQALKVGPTPTISGDGDQLPPPKGWAYVVESEDRGKATFNDSLTLYVYLCATKRLPNSEKRWHLEKVKGYPDGDVDFVELPVPSTPLCARTYAGDAQGTPGNDRFGNILNSQELSDDAKTRAEVWKSAYACDSEGEGVAEGLKLFRNVRVSGPIKDVALLIDGEIVRTRIRTGNLSDDTARSRMAAKRIANRRIMEAGKVVT